MLLRETGGLWENWLITKTAFPPSMGHAPCTPATGLSPHELFTGSELPCNRILLNVRAWGCPAFTLNPKLQDGRKLPKWHMKTRQGMCFGSSPAHSPAVGRILNLRTGVISPQHHVMHDELFSTVQGSLTDAVFDRTAWTKLLELLHWQ